MINWFHSSKTQTQQYETLLSRAFWLRALWATILCLSPPLACIAAETNQLDLVNIEYWPGNGVGIDILIKDQQHQPITANQQNHLQLVNPETGTVLSGKVQKLKKTKARVAVIIINSKHPEKQKEIAAAAKQLITLRPASELFGLYVYADKLRLATDFTNDRHQLLKTLENIQKIQTNQNLPNSFQEAGKFQQIVQLDPGATDYFRGTIVISEAGLSKLFIQQLRMLSPWPVTNIFVEQTLSDYSIIKASNWLDSYKNQGFYRAALCNRNHSNSVEVQLNGIAYTAAIEVNSKQQNHDLCDLEKIVNSIKEYPSKLYFEFDEQQLDIYKNSIKHFAREDFRLTVKLNPEETAYPAKAHLRGQSSLRLCKRKSYSLELTKGMPSNLMPLSTSNDFFLLAMCIDPMNLRSHTAFQLWQSLGLFPLRHRFIELFIDQKSQGNYILLENPAQYLPQKLSQVSSMIRRKLDDPETLPTIKYSSSTATQSLGDYVNAFLDMEYLSEQELIAQLEKVLDLDKYITHLATATILSNGDYVDEVLFIQQPAVATDGSFIKQYTPSKWDPDELFTLCHVTAMGAMKDPWEIAYCVESELGKTILKHPSLYKRFIDRLEELLSTKLSEQALSLALNNTARLVIGSFQNEGPLLNTKGLKTDSKQPMDAATATKMVQQQANEIIGLYQEQRELLLTNIARYRASQTEQ